MHIGALTVLEGPPPPFDEFLDIIRGRLHLVPRYRQKLSFPPRRDRAARCGSTTRTSTSSTTCARPRCRARAARSSCCKLVARIFSQQLDRSKPLWEMWVVEGLEGGRFALISKTHHALIDGISGVDLATVHVRPDPEPREVEHPDEAVGAAPPSRRRRALLASGAVGIARTGRRRRGRPRRALATRPQEARAEVARRRSRGSARSSGPG